MPGGSQHGRTNYAALGIRNRRHSDMLLYCKGLHLYTPTHIIKITQRDIILRILNVSDISKISGPKDCSIPV